MNTTMDCSEISWLSEMGLDNSFFMDQCHDFMDTLDEEVANILGQDFDNVNCLSSSPCSTLLNTTPSTNSITSLLSTPDQSPPLHEPPQKLLKPNNFTNFSTSMANNNNNNPDSRASSTPIILNFGNASESHQQAVNNSNGRALNPDEEAAVSEVLRSQAGSFQDGDQEQSRQAVQMTKKPSRIRPPSQTYDHIIAERKRREQLSQRFVALSTIVPGLKKMDKTSVLGDAIKYLKHLQERVKTLEEQATKQTMESVVLVRRSQVMVEDEGSSDDKSGTSDEQPLPEIEARVCNSHILLRVHCEKHKGVLVNLLSKIEKLNLAVINTNVTPFGSLALDITIVAEMEKEFNLTVKEVVKRLRAALK